MIQGILYVCSLAVLLAMFLILPRRRQTKRFGVLLIVAVLLFELLVANFHSYHLWFGDYKETQVDLQAENVTVTDLGGGRYIEINDLDQRVGTLYFDVELPESSEENLGTSYVTVRVDAKDETQQGYHRYSVADGQIIRGVGRTAYVVLELSGKVSDLAIYLTPNSDCQMELNALTLNAPVPMELSLWRLLLPVGLLTAVYLLATHPAMLAPYGEKKKLCGRLIFLITAGLLLGAMIMTAVYQYNLVGKLTEGFALTSGNQITQELVDAFASGQVSLLEEPSPELLGLDNPYDWSERSSESVNYLWDHLLYEGKYYSYYGIAPVLLLFLPYHLLTGFYFPTPEAVLLFGALGILFLSLLYLTFCDLFAKRIPVNMVLTGLLVCQLSSGVWYNFAFPRFYEIAQSSGFCFTCMGFYFLLRAGVIGDRPIRLPSLAAGGFCLALAVLCRPTLALYCVAALGLLYLGWKKYRQQLRTLKPKQRRGGTARYLISALAGFAVLGGLQMLYNYVRFGSILDFGIQYSLTINDFTRAEYHTDFVMIGYHNYLFAAPKLLPEFPYVFPNLSELDINGYYFLADNNAVGIFFRALPALGLWLIPMGWRALKREERLPACLALLSVCVVMPLGIIFSVWESGYSARYCLDFSWQMILGGIAVLYLLYARCAQEQTRRLLQMGFIVSAVWALACHFGMTYTYMGQGGYLESGFMAFERVFNFWM